MSEVSRLAFPQTFRAGPAEPSRGLIPPRTGRRRENFRKRQSVVHLRICASGPRRHSSPAKSPPDPSDCDSPSRRDWSGARSAAPGRTGSRLSSCPPAAERRLAAAAAAPPKNSLAPNALVSPARCACYKRSPSECFRGEAVRPVCYRRQASPDGTSSRTHAVSGSAWRGVHSETCSRERAGQGRFDPPG